jgi:hypothetical protein
MHLFIHICNGPQLMRDPEGAEFASVDAAVAEATQSARDLIAQELTAGREVPSNWQALVATGDGTIIEAVPFSTIAAAPANGVHSLVADAPRKRSSEFAALYANAQRIAEQSRSTTAEMRSLFGDIRDQLRRMATLKTS